MLYLFFFLNKDVVIIRLFKINYTMLLISIFKDNKLLLILFNCYLKTGL